MSIASLFAIVIPFMPSMCSYFRVCEESESILSLLDTCNLFSMSPPRTSAWISAGRMWKRNHARIKNKVARHGCYGKHLRQRDRFEADRLPLAVRRAAARVGAVRRRANVRAGYRPVPSTFTDASWLGVAPKIRQMRKQRRKRRHACLPYSAPNSQDGCLSPSPRARDFQPSNLPRRHHRHHHQRSRWSRLEARRRGSEPLLPW